MFLFVHPMQALLPMHPMQACPCTPCKLAAHAPHAGLQAAFKRSHRGVRKSWELPDTFPNTTVLQVRLGLGVFFTVFSPRF